MTSTRKTCAESRYWSQPDGSAPKIPGSHPVESESESESESGPGQPEDAQIRNELSRQSGRRDVWRPVPHEIFGPGVWVVMRLGEPPEQVLEVPRPCVRPALCVGLPVIGEESVSVSLTRRSSVRAVSE
jgi:hypothetical protein